MESNVLRLSPLALLTGAVLLPAQGHAAPITLTPNASFSVTPYNLSFDGGTTTSYTFFKPSGAATAGAVDTFANGIKGYVSTDNGVQAKYAYSFTMPFTLPLTNPALVQGTDVQLFGDTTDLYYLLQFRLDGTDYQANAEVRDTFTLVSVTYQAVPEPASLALLATGAAGLLALRRRQAAG